MIDKTVVINPAGESIWTASWLSMSSGPTHDSLMAGLEGYLTPPGIWHIVSTTDQPGKGGMAKAGSAQISRYRVDDAQAFTKIDLFDTDRAPVSRVVHWPPRRPPK